MVSKKLTLTALANEILNGGVRAQCYDLIAPTHPRPALPPTEPINQNQNQRSGGRGGKQAQHGRNVNEQLRNIDKSIKKRKHMNNQMHLNRPQVQQQLQQEYGRRPQGNFNSQQQQNRGPQQQFRAPNQQQQFRAPNQQQQRQQFRPPNQQQQQQQPFRAPNQQQNQRNTHNPNKSKQRQRMF